MALGIMIVIIASFIAGRYYLRNKDSGKHLIFTDNMTYVFRDDTIICISESCRDLMTFSIDAIGRDAEDDHVWQKGVFILTDKHLALYKKDQEVPILYLPIESVAAYFHVKQEKKHYQMWIHIESHLWYLLKLEFKYAQERRAFRELLRSLEYLTNKELHTAYRTNPPYSHLGTISAHEVNADDEGWILEDSVQLFLMPLHLVVMDEEGFVLYKIPIMSINAIEIIHEDKGQGIIQLTVDGAYQSFALEDYGRWVNAINQAIDKLLEGS